MKLAAQGGEWQSNLRIIGFGPIDLPGLQTVSLLSKTHISNYDVFVLTSESAAEHFRIGLTLPNDRFINIRKEVEHHLRHILTICEAGASIIVFLDGPYPSFTVNSPSGKKAFSIGQLPIFDLCPLEELVGTDLEICDSSLSSILNTVRVGYRVAVNSSKLIPLLKAPSRLKGETKVIAAYCKPFSNGGVILFCPSFLFALEFRYATSSELVKPHVAGCFIRAALELSRRQEAPQLPAWANRLSLPREHELSGKIRDAQQHVKRLKVEIEKLEKELKKSEWIKQLITAADDPLEHAVRRAFEELGVFILPGPNKRADAIALIDNTIVAIEVKGYEGAAKENLTGQIARWLSEIKATPSEEVEERDNIIAEYARILEELGITTPIPEGITEPIVKGLVIANTHRNRPVFDRPSLLNRQQEHFPQPLLRKLRADGVAALTGVQLIGLLNHARTNPGEAHAALRDLTNTAGLFEKYTDPRQFLLEDASPA